MDGERDPDRHAAALQALGDDVEGLVSAVQGLLIHGAALAAYGLEPAAFDRATLDVNARLDRILAADPSPLAEARPPQARAVGTCRDYAQLVCAALRARGGEARIRCGFADYFAGLAFEDHWICEVRQDGRWRRIDAQLDEITRAAHGIAFDPADLPDGRFLSADEAWRGVRAGRWPAEQFGHGDEAGGLWFMAVNVIRDRLALSGQVTSAWDRWREAGSADRTHTPAELEAIDAVAAGGSRPPPIPPWERR
jgi:hypothetical protein